MKIFGKFLATSIFMLILLGSGLYLALNNLGLMLSEDHAGLKYRRIASGIEIQTGNRVAKVQLKLPVTIHYCAGKWEIKNGDNVIATFDANSFSKKNLFKIGIKY